MSGSPQSIMPLEKEPLQGRTDARSTSKGSEGGQRRSKGSTRFSRNAKAIGLPGWMKCWLAGLSLLLLSFWVLPAVLFLRGATSPPLDGPNPAAVAEEPSDASEPCEVLEGPWGRLQLVPIVISPPAEPLRQLDEMIPNELIWRFPDTSASQLSELLIGLGLPESLMAELRGSMEMAPAIDGFTVKPSPELVLGLDPEVRTRLYRALYAFRANEAWCARFCFQGDSPEQWLDSAPLAAETRRLVYPLVYRQGSFLFFSDLPVVKPLLPSQAEREALVTALSHESTYLVQLQVSADSDLEALTRYWGRGGREKDVSPLLRSLVESPAPQSLDIIHLLPPLARRRIYTYPEVAEVVKNRRDCHWTAVNFFAEQPDDRFCQPNTLAGELAENYYPINGNLRLGDLIVYTDVGAGGRTRVVHSAVHIAGDLMLTKNGPSPARPWMFMKREHMKDFYPRTSGFRQCFFRRKGI